MWDLEQYNEKIALIDEFGRCHWKKMPGFFIV